MFELMFLLFFVFMIVRVPIAVALGLSSVIAIFVHTPIPLMILPQKVFSGLNSFPYLSIPLFLLAGNIMIETKISQKLVGLSSLLVRKNKAGMAQITTVSSAFFGSISGSSPATTAAIGSLMIPEMLKRGYAPHIAAAIVAASGALGLIIPPSLTMVVYGVISGTSIGDLFIAGIIPGVLICLALMLVQKRTIDESGSSSNSHDSSFDTKAVYALLMPLIIIGGIYSGAFTATESAGVACIYGLLIGIFVYRNINLSAFYKILRTTAESTASVMILMACANLFGFVITAEKIPQTVALFITGMTENTYFVMLLIMVFLLIVGTFLDNVTALLLVVPTFMPVVNALSIDPVYFGVFAVIALSVGQFTPPVGLNLLISSNISGSPIEKISKSIFPYLMAYILVLALLVAFPFIITAII